MGGVLYAAKSAGGGRDDGRGAGKCEYPRMVGHQIGYEKEIEILKYPR